MNQSVIHARTKTTPLFSATSHKSPTLPAHQVNQVVTTKAMAKVIEEIHQTPKVEGKEVVVSLETKEAKLLKVTKPILFRVKQELAKAKARKVKAKVLTQKQKQSQIPKVSPSLKQTPVDLL